MGELLLDVPVHRSLKSANVPEALEAAGIVVAAAREPASLAAMGQASGMMSRQAVAPVACVLQSSWHHECCHGSGV